MDDLTRMAMRYSLARPTAHVVIKSVIEVDVEAELAALRESDPEAAMLLGEYIVHDDPRNDPPPQ